MTQMSNDYEKMSVTYCLIFINKTYKCQDDLMKISTLAVYYVNYVSSRSSCLIPTFLNGKLFMHTYVIWLSIPALIC